VKLSINPIIKKFIYSIIIALSAIVPTYIFTEGNIESLIINGKTIFVLLLLCVVVIGAIFMVFEKDRVITSRNTDEAILKKIQEYRPILVKIIWAIIAILVIWAAIGFWATKQTHNIRVASDAVKQSTATCCLGASAARADR
jgi:hypothetical protein